MMPQFSGPGVADLVHDGDDPTSSTKARVEVGISRFPLIYKTDQDTLYS